MKITIYNTPAHQQLHSKIIFYHTSTNMKITKISVYQVDLPLHEKTYKWSGGKGVATFDCTLLKIDTDDPTISGVGEVTPLGPFYLPAYGPGARTGIAELAPHLIGEDPTLLGNINLLMDKNLLGHPYCKSAIDMACWDSERAKRASFDEALTKTRDINPAK